MLHDTAADGHSPIGDSWMTCLSILNFIRVTSNLFYKRLSSISEQDINIDS
jgi:hypothetical protein